MFFPVKNHCIDFSSVILCLWLVLVVNYSDAGVAEGFTGSVEFAPLVGSLVLYGCGTVSSANPARLTPHKSRFLDGCGVLTNNQPANQKWEHKAGNSMIHVTRPSYPGQKRNKAELIKYPTPAILIQYPKYRGKTPHNTIVEPKINMYTPPKTLCSFIVCYYS
jgi:hypothetical protein